jgi:hypothetical protein
LRRRNGKDYAPVFLDPVLDVPPPHKMVEYSQANGIRGGKIHFCRRPDGNLNAQIGKRFRNVVLRGGILDSTGGIGVDYMALNDRLKLTFEAFDFSSNRNAHLKGYADLQLFKYLYLTGGWDDFISNQGNSSGFVGLSIRFEDDDLKYLLTSTPIPK